MKKTDKIMIVILVVFTILGIVTFLILNSRKKAITIEKFEEKAKELGYNIANMQNEMTQKEEVTDVKVAMSEDYSYMIKFYVLKDKDIANDFYHENREAFDKLKKQGNVIKEKNSKNYNTYSLKNDEKYMYISKVDNTILQLSVNQLEEQRVMEFVKKLGY